MISHEPWIGNHYETGLHKHPAQKIAIVGYSHYTDEADTARLTNDTVCAVIEGRQQHRFFSAIPSWFGYDDLAMFWNAVMFFNFLPNVVGTKDEKFADGTREQVIAGQRRFLSILAVHRPDKAFVVSTKAWKVVRSLTLRRRAVSAHLSHSHRTSSPGAPIDSTILRLRRSA